MRQVIFALIGTSLLLLGTACNSTAELDGKANADTKHVEREAKLKDSKQSHEALLVKLGRLKNVTGKYSDQKNLRENLLGHLYHLFEEKGYRSRITKKSLKAVFNGLVHDGELTGSLGTAINKVVEGAASYSGLAYFLNKSQTDNGYIMRFIIESILLAHRLHHGEPLHMKDVESICIHSQYQSERMQYYQLSKKSKTLVTKKTSSTIWPHELDEAIETIEPILYQLLNKEEQEAYRAAYPSRESIVPSV